MQRLSSTSHREEFAGKYHVFHPISVTGVTSPWLLMVDVENSLLLAKPRSTTLQLALTGLAIAAVFSFIVFWFSGKIARTLLQASETIARIAGTLHQSGNHFAHASQSLSQGVTEQAAALQQTRASMKQVASMASVNSNHAAQAREITTQACKDAELGAHHIESLQRSMQELQDSAQNISKIIKTIDEIAFQTSILALNAAVEAARAGEHGQGFAVVADKVRQLAQRSAQASRETAALISESIRRSKAGIESSAKVSASFHQILNQVRTTGNFTSEIADATREQSSGIQHIAQALHKLDHVTQANAQTATQTAAASRQLLALSKELQHSIKNLLILALGARAAQPQQQNNKTHGMS